MPGERLPTSGVVGTERPATPEEIISAFAKQHKIPPALALAVARKESSLNPNAVGDSGLAIGTFQLHAGAAEDTGVTDRSDPIQNIQGGVKYLRQLSDRYDGDVNKILLAYNGGMGNVDRGTVSPQAQAYATDVMSQLRTGALRTAGAVTSQPGTVPAAAPPAPGAPLPSPLAERARQQQLTRTDLPADVRAQLGTLGGQQPDQILSNLSSVDPRSQEGRENIAGIAGSVGVGMMTEGLGAVPGVLPWVARVVGPVVGAMTGGGAEAAGEIAAGTAAPGTSPVVSGLKQGAYEAGGHAFMWPVKRLGKAFLGSRVRVAAESALESSVASARATVGAVQSRVTDGVAAATEMARQAIAATRTAASSQVAAVTRQAGQQVVGAKKLAATLVADTELSNAAAIADVQRQYDNLLATPPDALAPGALTKEAVEGPAKKALDLAGQRVQEAAQRGPMIKMTPIQTALETMVKKARPASIFENAESPAATIPGYAGFSENAKKIIADQLGVPETHPLPGLLGQIQAAPEEISFADAHKLKMLLDEGVNWDRAAKRHLEKITKGLRTTLRDSLGVHEPYNVATAAYQAMVPLYRKGIGRRVITAASTPGGADAIAKTLNAKNPAQALALRDLILTQSAAGGDAELGQQAWDAIRSSFVYDRVLRGGVKDLSGRVRALVAQNPAFAKAVLNDEASQRVISNLDRVGQAYTLAVEHAQAALAATKTAVGEQVAQVGEAGAATIAQAKGVKTAQVEKAKQAASDAIRAERRAGARASNAARAGVRTAQETLTQFQRSSIGRPAHAAITGGDVAAATMRGPTSLWGARAIMRLLEGPTSADLLQWMAYSDANTQRVIRILTSQVPDRVAATTIRELVHALTLPAKPAAPSPTATAATAATSP